MKQQTAVEWLYNILCDKGYFRKLPVSEFKEALQMENEQIVNAYYQCGRDNFEHIKVINKSATEYYNETYTTTK